MKDFLKMFFASLLAGGTFFLLTLIVLFSMGAEPEVIVPKNSVLTLNLNAQIKERSNDNPLASFNPLSMSSEKTLGLDQMIRAIEAAKTHDKIQGIRVQFGGFSGGFSSLKRLRDALIDFKESGKFIYTYQEVYSQRAYFIASVADSVFVNPTGGLEWRGLGTQVTYYTKMLKKFGIEPQIIRGSNNQFKSAVEPFLTEEMSPANRLQLETLLGDIWSYTTDAVAQSRGLTAKDLMKYADEAPMQEPEEALEKGMIDVIAYEDEYTSALKSRLGVAEDRKIKTIGYSKFLKSLDDEEDSKNEIAIIYAEGDIVDGSGSGYQVDSERFTNAIRKARKDKDIKAVVLRVNSPGGSAMASDVIWRELYLLKAEKPLIVSMGDLAASGGYYISAPGDSVLAEPTTITGSIGVFGMFFTAGELLEDDLGLVYETVKTSEFADMPAINRPLNEAERSFFQKNVDRTYGKFLSRVVNGRGLDSLYVDSIGQGRVWTGSRAVALGLVDALGNLDDALAIAANKADIEDYQTIALPKFKDPVQQLIEDLTGSQIKRELKGTPLESTYKAFEKAQFLIGHPGIQMRMEYELIW